MTNLRKTLYLDRCKGLTENLNAIVKQMDIVNEALGKDVDKGLSSIGINLNKSHHGFDKNKWSNFGNTIQRLKLISEGLRGRTDE